MKKTIWGVLIVLLLNLALYFQTVGFDFILDDRPLILENAQQYRDLTAFARSLGRPYFDDPAFPLQHYWRPVSGFSFFLDFQLYGAKPAGYHLTNILLNALNGILLFLLIYGWAGRWMPALLSALLFSLHPLHAENVAWISGRPDLLVMLFVLLTLLALLRYHRTRRALFYWLSVPAFTLALLAKETAVFALLLVPAILLFVRARKKWLVHSLPYFAAGGWYLLFHLQVTGMPGSDGPVFPPPGMLLRTLGAYGRMIFLPYFKGPFYDMGEFDRLATINLLIGVFFIVTVILLILNRRRWPFSFIALGSLVFLAGVINPHLVHYPNLSIRYVYIPVLLAAVLAGEWATQKWGQEKGGLPRYLPLVLVIVIGATWAVENIYYQGFFREEAARIERLHRLFPGEDSLLIHMGVMAYNRGDLNRALEYLDRGIVENRHNPWIDFSFKARILKARIFTEQGRYPPALGEIDHALNSGDRSADEKVTALMVLMEIQQRRGDFRSALSAVNRALKIQEDPGLLLRKIDLQIRLGDMAGARKTLREAAHRYPRMRDLDRFQHLLRQAER